MELEAEDSHELDGASPQPPATAEVAVEELGAKRARGKGKAKSKAEAAPKAKGKAEANAKAKAGPKAGARRNKGGNQATGEATASAGEDQKKCAECDTLKPISDFYEGQGRCSCCNNRRRQYQRYVASQKAEVQVKALEESDPATAKRAYRHYCKLKDQADAEKTKVKLNLIEYVEAIKCTEGLRKVKDGEMMWQEQYRDWAKTAVAILGLILC